MNQQVLNVLVAVILTAVVMLFIFMAITQGNTNKMVKMANTFESNQAILIAVCKIDLNALQKREFETQRCDAWANLLEQGHVDQNFYDSKGCSKGLDWNGY